MQVCGLRPVPLEAVKALKEGEQEKEKSYRALCWLPRRLTDADVRMLAAAGPLILTQRTPIRVLHRRANMPRERAVYELRAERLVAQQQQREGGEYFLLRLRTAAGTYIKEFVHGTSLGAVHMALHLQDSHRACPLPAAGDLGRTQPSLGDLLGGCRAEIASLDVMEVHMERHMV